MFILQFDQCSVYFKGYCCTQNIPSKICNFIYYLDITFLIFLFGRKRLKKSEDNSFGNEVYNVQFDNKESFDIFGTKYHFKLHEVVDCPEFLVYFPLVEKLVILLFLFLNFIFIINMPLLMIFISEV